MPTRYRFTIPLLCTFLTICQPLPSEPVLVDGTAVAPTHIAELTPCTDGILFSRNTPHTPHAYFDSLFRIGGTLALNGGHLTLGKDMQCASSMTFYSGGYCDGQFNTLFLPHNDEQFFFPTKSLWLPPVDGHTDEPTPDDDEPSLELPNLLTTGITSWHQISSDSYIAVVPAHDRKKITMYTMDHSMVTDAIATDFLMPINRIDWAPGYPDCIVSTQDDSFFLSLNGGHTPVIRPLVLGSGTIKSISWSADGSRCAIGVHLSLIHI